MTGPVFLLGGLAAAGRSTLARGCCGSRAIAAHVDVGSGLAVLLRTPEAHE